MPVLARFEKGKAFLRDGRWRSANAALETMLNDATAEWIRVTGGPKLSDRDQERTVARHIADQLGGKILVHMRSRTGRSAAAFIQQRQMKLEFSDVLPNSRRAIAG